jgi:hypothetical protein
MNDSPKYPKFVWIIGMVVLVIIVGYVLFSGQPVQEIEFPGGRAKFGPKPKDEAVSFFISYTRDNHVVEGSLLSIWQVLVSLISMLIINSRFTQCHNGAEARRVCVSY